MSKNVGVFVDVANLYYAAKSAGVDVDYVTLLKGAVRGRDLIRAYAYSGLDPENENQRKFIEFLSKNGYKVVVKDIRKYGDGKIKANLDIELVVDLFRLADRMDAAVIISGDGDFAPAIRALQDKGVRAEVISFRGNTSSDLIAVADEFIDIMKVVQVGRTKKDAVVAPEMPAKEVTPEFSFREAPPGVAAAARAALRTGARSGGRAAARRGEPPPVLAVAVGSEAEERAERGEIPFQEEELVATAGEPSEPGSRRRRRRGGRGRGGRGRTDAAERVAAEPVPAEPGSDEFDSLSELDLGDDREYAFSEADEATLVELGLLAPGGTAGAVGGAGGGQPSAASDAAPTNYAVGMMLSADDLAAEQEYAAGRPASAAEPGGLDTAAAAPVGADEGDVSRPRRGRRGGRGRGRAEREAAAAPETRPRDEPAAIGAAAEPAQEPPAARARPRRRTARATRPDEPGAEGAPAAGTTTRRARSRRSTDDSRSGGDASAAPEAEAQPARARAPRGRRRSAASGEPAADARQAAESPARQRRATPRRTGEGRGRAASGQRPTPPAAPEESDARVAAAEPAAAPPASRAANAPAATPAPTPAAPQDGEPRGIWQRLLSGRKR